VRLKSAPSATSWPSHPSVLPVARNDADEQTPGRLCGPTRETSSAAGMNQENI